MSPRERYAPHFTAAELDVNEPVPARYRENARQVAQLLEWLRDVGNRASPLPVWIDVTSCYRSPARNVSVNGADGSQHLTASAADGIAQGISPRALAAAVLQEARAGRAPAFGQLILYVDSPHFHISLPRAGRNGELLVGYDREQRYLPLAAHVAELPDAPRYGDRVVVATIVGVALALAILT